VKEIVVLTSKTLIFITAIPPMSFACKTGRNAGSDVKKWRRVLRKRQSPTAPKQMRKQFNLIVRNVYGQTSYCFV